MKKRRFKHLSWTDRLKIETMLKDKRHKQEIADEIRRSPENDLQRNQAWPLYSYEFRPDRRRKIQSGNGRSGLP